MTNFLTITTLCTLLALAADNYDAAAYAGFEQPRDLASGIEQRNHKRPAIGKSQTDPKRHKKTDRKDHEKKKWCGTRAQCQTNYGIAGGLLALLLGFLKARRS